MCKLEMMIESERKKRMELDKKANVLVAELEREKKNVREKAEVETRNLRKEADSLKRKVEVRKKVSVRPKNRVEGGRSGNGTEQVKINNLTTKSEEGACK